MRILVLCNKSPFPPSEGGPIAMNAIIQGLLSAGHEVKVLAVNSSKHYVDPAAIPKEFLDKTGIELVDFDLSVSVEGALLNLLRQRSYHVERFRNREFRQKLIEILSTASFDVIQLETLFLCPYISAIRKHTNAPVVLRAHNIEHLIWARLASEEKNPIKKLYLKHLAHTLRRYEITVIDKLDGVATITAKDAGWFASLNKEIPVEVVTFGMDIPDREEISSGTDYSSLFHIGSMNWMPNEEGLRWFLKEVWPGINTAFPSVTLTLAGRHMPGWLKGSKFPNVNVIGEVENAAQFIRQHGVLLVPLLSGSGVRIKILEAMLAGKPVISTTIGAEGINYTHGENILIANTPREWADCVGLIAGNHQLARRIGANAAALVRQHHDIRHITQDLISFYEGLISESGRKRRTLS